MHLSRGEAGHRRLARISARSHTISDRNFCGREFFFEIFGPRRAKNGVQTRTPRHARARQRPWGPVCIAARRDIVHQHGYRRDLTVNLMRSRTENFAAAKIFSKFSVRIAAENSRNPSRRGMSMLVRDFEDQLGVRRGRASSLSADFGAIERDLGPKILRPRKHF